MARIVTDRTLLSRSWISVCFLSTIEFSILLALIQIDHLHSDNPICRGNALPPWLKRVYLVSAAVFLVKAVLVLIHWIIAGRASYGTTLDLMGISGTCFAILFFAGMSSLLTGLWNWGGTCVDSFGVVTPATQSIEWLACVPLLFYYVLSVEVRDKYTMRDKIVIFSITVSMALLLLINISMPYGAAVFFFTLAHLMFICVVVFFLDFNPSWSITRYVRTLLGEEEVALTLEGSDTKRRLKIVFAFTMPLFPIVYYLGMSKIVPDDVISVMFIFINLLDKLLFSSVALDSYTHMLYSGFAAMSRANQARQMYLRYIMHEVRVPLSSIYMGIDALALDVEDIQGERLLEGASSSRSPSKVSAAAETLQMMREASAFMGDTLNSALNMQKIEDGKFELSLAPFEISALLRKVSQTLQGTIVRKRIVLRIVMDPGLPPRVIGDQFQIEHVLANLLSNAIKFSPEGSSIDIHLSRDRGVPANSPSIKVGQIIEDVCRIRFEVRDYGVGIAQEDVSKLFQPFVQIRPQELQQGGGTGVGLSICKQIIELHGGRVGCESVIGEGSTFFFVVPFLLPPVNPLDREFSVDVRSKAQVSDVRRQSSIVMSLFGTNPSSAVGGDDPTPVPSPSSALSFTTHSHNLNSGQRYLSNVKTALIVDDVASNRKLLMRLVSRRGVICFEAVDGAEAVAMIRGGLTCDLIFMDQQMPNMNGVEATKILRQMGFDRLIVALTGDAMDMDRSTFLSAGADILLAKPMKLEYLNKLFDFVVKHGTASHGNRKLRVNLNEIDFIE